jgi:uncharacterized protein YaaW (UPF0174 family)
MRIEMPSDSVLAHAARRRSITTLIQASNGMFRDYESLLLIAVAVRVLYTARDSRATKAWMLRGAFSNAWVDLWCGVHAKREYDEAAEPVERERKRRGFNMGYREDEDLSLLGRCSSEDLEPIVQYLTRDKDGSTRWAENLTKCEGYHRWYPDHRRYWKEIASEIQLFGGNSFASLFRGGEGVLYREVLTDVCDKMNVNYNKKAPTNLIELQLLQKILTDSLEKMSEEERREVVKQLDLKTTDFTAQVITVALQAAIRVGGFAAYQIALVVANAVAKQILGHGLRIVANAALTRTMAIFAGPIGWALSALWLAVDIAGPAYRVTIPSVVHVAFLRAKAEQKNR